jgi:hypothetical protein
MLSLALVAVAIVFFVVATVAFIVAIAFIDALLAVIVLSFLSGLYSLCH